MNKAKNGLLRGTCLMALLSFSDYTDTQNVGINSGSNPSATYYKA